MNITRLRSRQSGMGLLEVVLGVGLISIVLAMLSSVTTMSYKNHAKVVDSKDLQDIRGIFRARFDCELTLAPLPDACSAAPSEAYLSVYDLNNNVMIDSTCSKKMGSYRIRVTCPSSPFEAGKKHLVVEIGKDTTETGSCNSPLSWKTLFPDSSTGLGCAVTPY